MHEKIRLLNGEKVGDGAQDYPYMFLSNNKLLIIPSTGVESCNGAHYDSKQKHSLGFCLLAKVEEAADKPIYKWTYHIVSGHTLKHLCAAMVPVFLTLMLAKRTIETER
ncbi:unnamed protein product [Camellia sinensis]